MNRKLVLQIEVLLDAFNTVKGENGEATMILFHGNFTSEYGSGVVLPGGVDTQVEYKGQKRSLSARYILQGTDKAGKVFNIFVENNGECSGDMPFITTPKVLTDCKDLAFLEKDLLQGEVHSAGEGKVLIKIFICNNGA